MEAPGLTAPVIKKFPWKKVRLGLIAGGAAVIVGVGGWQLVDRLTATCGGGTSSYQGECVGVTDGSYVFDPSAAAIEATIKTQDARAQATGDYVSIAMLTPLTSTPDSDVTPERIRQTLEGAATAQAILNGQGYRPAIRLLLANEGSGQQAWPQVVSQLQDWPADQHLVAVVGVGLSTIDTVLAGRQLASSASPLPMIGSVDTGDGLNTNGPQPPLVPPALSGRIYGLVRVEPTVADEVTLLSGYYGRYLRKASPGAVLVYDNDPADLYTGSLSLDFSQQLGARINLISKLRTLTNCPSHGTITVLTGADAESLSPATATGPNPDGPAIDVIYPNIADSSRLQSWYRRAFEGSPADVSASWAIMTFDAVTAAEQAAVQAGQGSSSPPARNAVTSLLYDFNKLSDPIKGATGPFVITSDGDEGCQWIPLIIDQKGTATILSQTKVGCSAS